MAVIVIRKVPDEVCERLRKRAARKKRSVEAEARAILIEAVQDADVDAAVRRVQAYVSRHYKGPRPTRVVDDLIAERRKAAQRGE